MLNNKNMLLGYGETLTQPVNINQNGGPKNKPYTYDENKPVILEKLQDLILNINTISPDALPDGKAVAKFVLHPTFLAKSYFPINLLNHFSLESIGSKSIRIKPRKDNKKKGRKNFYITICIYVSGKRENFELFIEALKKDTFKNINKLKNDFITLEDISILEMSDKIKSIDDDIDKVEVTLHTPQNSLSIEKKFENFALKNGVRIDENKCIRVKGLTFMSFKANRKDILKLAEFSFLRTIRKLPELRFNKPIITRSLENSLLLSLPSEPAINQNLKVAIFDGGIGGNDYELWVKEINLVSDKNTGIEPITHGLDVTSTILFGLIDSKTEILKTPYCNIDHYRVVDSNTHTDIDLFDVLIRIKSVLEKNNYDYVNISLGPRIPIDDDDVHVWTSTLEEIFAKTGTLCTIAAGNDGDLPDTLNRIQPPADLINALAVGAATSLSDNWKRCSYSCIGPGRSPGYIKPDGLAFGGSEEEPFQIYNPVSKGIVRVAGTSFAAPLVLRQAIALSTLLGYKITPLTAKALLIHHAEAKRFAPQEVGWGRFPVNISDVIYCDDNQVKVIYQGMLEPSQYMRALIPFPDSEIKGKINLKATFCFTSSVDVEHPINLTRSGLEITMRKNELSKNNTYPLFNNKNIYADENEKRSDGHKWETTLRAEHTFTKTLNITNPCFDIVYHERDRGIACKNQEKLEYVLVVTLSIENMPELYNLIRQKYQTLQPIEIQQQVRISN
jgi:hypothetical protein